MRKRRTRSHILADFSAHHVEGYALRCGYSVERVFHDYGIDLILFTYDANGEIESGQVFIQLKATESLNILRDQQTISFSIERSDLEYWLDELMPCILIIYDARAEQAYWVYIQAYFEGLPNFKIEEAGQTVAVHLRMADVVDEEAMRTFARFRDEARGKILKRIDYHG